MLPRMRCMLPKHVKRYMLCIVSVIVYILPTVLALLLPSDKIFLRIFLFYPTVELVICAIHESMHLFLFCIGGANATLIRVGIFQYEFCQKKFGFCLTGFFSGNCIARVTPNANRKVLIAAILSGGISGITIAAIFLLFGILFDLCSSPVFLCVIFTGTIKGAYALFSPKSTDRKFFNEWIGKS